MIKANFVIEDGKPFLQLKYSKADVDVLEGKFKCLGLSQAETEKGFGIGQNLKYWQEQNTELRRYLERTLRHQSIIDDVNKILYDGQNFNIAIFRVVPNEDRVVKVGLGIYISVLDIDNFITSLKRIYEAIMNIATDVRIEFRVEKEKIKLNPVVEKER